MKPYARFWRKVRQNHALTQAEMAFRLGISAATVTQVERGLRRYSLAQTILLIKRLDLNPETVVALLLENEEKKLNKAFRLNKKNCGPE